MSIKTKKVIKIIVVLLLLSISLILYSRYLATSGLKVKEYKVVNDKITDGLYGLKIVHISDIHYGRIVDLNKLETIVEKINLINPDIVVLTGDLFDRDIILSEKQKEEVISLLSKIDVKYNKYAVSGNHDYSHDYWNDIINKSNFINLDNNYDLIYGKDNKNIFIGGISTIADNIEIDEKIETFSKYVEENENMYKVLLLHEPDVIESFDYSKYDLILAGHSHNGQVRLPFIGAIVLPPNGKKYYDEYYKLTDTDFYISSGLGTSVANFRLFNKPSFNFYRLTNK